MDAQQTGAMSLKKDTCPVTPTQGSRELCDGGRKTHALEEPHDADDELRIAETPESVVGARFGFML